MSFKDAFSFHYQQTRCPHRELFALLLHISKRLFSVKDNELRWR